MKKVFVSGSIKLVVLPRVAKEYIDGFIKNGDKFLIGDCHGIDSIVQKYLVDKGYENVSIYTSGSEPRNFYDEDKKLNWEIVSMNAINDGDDRAYYSIKDRAMGDECDEAIAIWDGQSRATYANVEYVENHLGKKVILVRPLNTIDPRSGCLVYDK